MSINEEAYRLVLLYSGAEGLKALKDLADANGVAFEALNDDFRKGAISQREYIEGTLALAREGAKLGVAMRGVQEAIEATAHAGQEWADLQAKLAEMEGRSARAAEATAEARAAGTRAVEAEMQAIREGEQQAGEAMRARIEAYARAEREAEEFAREHRRAMEIVAEGERLAAAEARSMAAAMSEADSRIAVAEAELRMAGEKRTKQLDAEAGRTEWLARQTRGLEDALRDLHAHEQAAPRATADDLAGVGSAKRDRIEALAAAERQTRQWADSMDRLQQKFGPAGDAGMRFGRQMLFVSYAMQDFYQGGFAATLNNIPQLAMAFDVQAKYVGAVAIAGLAADAAFKVLAPTLRDLGRDLNIIQDPAKTFVVTVDQMKAKVEALTERPHRLRVEVDQLEQAKRQLDEMEKSLAAYEAHRQSAAAKDLARQAAEVVEKDIGGTEELARAIAMAERKQGFHNGDPRDEEMLRILREVQAAGGTEGEQRARFRARTGLNTSGIQGDIDVLETRIGQADLAAAKETAGAFARGVETAIQRVQGIAARYPELFQRVGPHGVDAAEAIGNLPPTQAEAERRAEWEHAEKIAEKVEKDRRDRANKAGDDAGQFVGETTAGAVGRMEQAAAAAQAAAQMVGGKSVERVRDSDAMLSAEAGKLDGRIKEQIESAILSNLMRINAGAPVARNAREYDRKMVETGIPPAIDPAAHAQILRAQVGQLLARSGDVDRGHVTALAGKIVGDAIRDAQERSARAFTVAGQGMNDLAATQAATAEVLGELAGQVQGLRRQGAQTRGQLRNAQGQIRQMNGAGGGTQFPFPFAPFQ